MLYIRDMQQHNGNSNSSKANYHHGHTAHGKRNKKLELSTGFLIASFWFKRCPEDKSDPKICRK